MNRRDWLKMLAAGAPAAVLYPQVVQATSSDTYLIVTDNPDSILSQMTGHLRRDVRIEERRVAPSPQDLTIIRKGSVIDPRRMVGIDERVSDLIAYLRSRSTPGTYLVTIEPSARTRPHEVRFEYDGQIFESLDRRKTYNEIVIPGTMGPTVFSLEEGRLRVVRSSCRHSLCKRSGPIRSGRIVCAPNRLVASIHGNRQTHDAITG